MSSSPSTSLPVVTRAPGRSLAAWWQALPLTAVFVLFFLIPLALILMVSFWDFNEYELLPGFTLKNYVSIFEGCGNTDETVRHLQDLSFDLQVQLSGLADHAGDGLCGVVLPGLSCALAGRADAAVRAVHDSVLDLERDPHDLVGAAAWGATAWSTRAWSAWAW